MTEGLLAIPGDALVITVGMPASGKSTFVARNFPHEAVISLDGIRARIGRPGDVTATAEAALHQQDWVSGRLSQGRLAVVANTHLLPVDRRRTVDLARAYRRPVTVILFDTPEAECRRRNATRSGLDRVPDAWMDLSSVSWQWTVRTIASEGLGTVVTVDPRGAREASVRILPPAAPLLHAGVA